jgi:N6-adenosine-specific RNA methylase IME4
MLPQALEVMAAWGFTYKSQFVWVKPAIKLGFWVRTRHELLLIGTRGEVPAPAPGLNFPSVIEAKGREHSRKPDEFYTILESYFPTVPKIELFARAETPRAGWEHWGAEAGATESAEPRAPSPAPRPATAPGPDAAAFRAIAAGAAPTSPVRPFVRAFSRTL